MDQEFGGRVALVTGATSGIGKATALGLGKRGAHVLVSGRDTARGEAVVAAIEAAGGTAAFLAADLGNAEAARDLARRANAAAGKVDILVNNAGVFPFGPTAETAGAFANAFTTNVESPFVLVGQLAPRMAERGKGAIVNVTTMVAEIGNPAMPLYGSSKAALNLLTKAWAAEFGPKGVRVNAVAPGPTRTEGTAPMGDAVDQMAAMAPAGHAATADEIADAIIYLASDRASFIHGAILPVDGGRTAI